MRCKCCGEEAQFTLKEEGFWKNRYLCSNCNKYFWADRNWTKALKIAGTTYGVVSIATRGIKASAQYASGDLIGGTITLAGLGEDNNPSTNA